MLLSHLKRLCTLCSLLPTIIPVSAQNTSPAPSTTELPSSFRQAVPACAQPCLQAALLERFPLVCTVPISLSCLCSRYSSRGETLGEVALGCIYSSCSTVDSQAASAYNICIGQKDAVSQTQSVLTVTAGGPIMSQLTATTSTIRTRSTSTLVTTTRTPSPTINIDSISSTSSATSFTSSPSRNATAAGVASAPSPPTMKPAQIAGLSVAVAAALILAIGLMALSVFLRKRREARVIIEVDEEKRRTFQPPTDYSRISVRDFTAAPSQHAPPKQFPLHPVSRHQSTVIFTAPTTSNPPKDGAVDIRSIHPLARPAGLKSRNASNLSVPLEQIGLAISAEAPGRQTTVTSDRPQRPRKAELRQQRPRSLRYTMDSSRRPDSVLTQDTVFEEDAQALRRRSSKLLPTPPVPIPPIRSFQPSRPPPEFIPTMKPTPAVPTRSLGPQQPELFLNIPVRHSRSLAELAPPKPEARPAYTAPLAPPFQLLTVHDQNASRAISTASSDGNTDIPDYYFSDYEDSPQIPPVPAWDHSRLQAESTPRSVNVRPKISSSTVSRTLSQATSRASTNIRDSVASQTSFESIDSNDPTPEDEDDDKQLSDDKLSPIEESQSPISMLRYPKIPRASNQLVSRSEQSPRSPQSYSPLNQQSPRRLPAPKRHAEPSALHVKRRGQTEALRLQDRLKLDSPRRTEVREHIKNLTHVRSNSVEPGNPGSSRSAYRHTRVQSGQEPLSPAMYETSSVQPLNVGFIPPEETPEYDALKSPMWVPNLTPKRHGDDLFLSVSYSKPAQ